MMGVRPIVAVVDDDTDVRQALRRLLRSVGFEAAAYASGHKFMQDAARLGPDCVVLDLHMPGYSGFDVQQALAEAALDIAVIMLTGQDSPGNRARALTNGAHAYLIKPVDDELLIDAILSATLLQ